MAMKPFLKSIAEAYTRRYADLSRFRFVFPSKRSGTFFRKYLAEACPGRVMIAPDITTVADLAFELSGRLADNRVDLLFTLYDAYRDLLRSNSTEEKDIPAFDAFRSWGEVVLSDFNDVDMFCVDAEELFSNVRDFREIATDYLTDEQRDVMNEYFGEPAYREHFDRFWKSYDYKSDLPGATHSGVRDRFMLLWQTLGELYGAMRTRLDATGMAYPGLAYRLALKRLTEEGADALGCDRIVFIGFNALSKIEWLIFSEMSKLDSPGIPGEKMADFFWDDSSPVLHEKNCSAAKFILKDSKQFPPPAWADMSESDASSHFPDIKIITSPSNSYQTKIAGAELARLRREGEEDFADARVAVVLPDENLLLPMLYSLPENVDQVNLTMGFSIRLTSAATYVQLLRRLQIHKRVGSDGVLYQSSDVVKLFSHPYLMAICGSDAIMRLKGMIARARKFMVARQDVCRLCKGAEALMNPLMPEAGAEGARAYLEEALSTAAEALRRGKNADRRLNARLDIDYIEVYADALRRLSTAIRSHGIDMTPNSFFSLTDRLIGGETVTFEGEPLTGLQVMGLLETRCLDFDYVVIPSMNERIFPRRMRARSFIPLNLRIAYGMPAAGYDESVFSYYFYRLISRTRGASLIYDSRTSGLSSGDPSRYLLQLKHLYAKGKISFEEYRFGMGRVEETEIVFDKSRATQETLKQFVGPDATKALSASSLMKYMTCPKQFYFEKILGLKPREELTEGLDPIAMGNIVHKTLLEIYLPEELRNNYLKDGVLIDRPRLERILADKPALRSIIGRNILEEKYPGKEVLTLSPDLEMMADVILRQVAGIVRTDLAQAPFYLHGLEFSDTTFLTLDDGRQVKFTYTIDRLDRPASDPEANFRIVDYKTGSLHASPETVEEAASASYRGKHLFQLQLYANLLNTVQGCQQRPLSTAIYGVNNAVFFGEGPKKKNLADCVVTPSIGGTPLADHLGYITEDRENFNDIFMENVRSTVKEILNPDEPFRPARDSKACTYCPLRESCRR